MKYHTFKTQFAKEVAAQHGENAQVVIEKIPKNNGIINESMTILKGEGEAVPVIGLETYYAAYLGGTPVEELADRFLQEFSRNRILEKQELESFLDFEKAAKHICYKIINYEKNKEMLSQIPHRRILDLALVYYYRFEQFGDYSASIMIHNDHIQHWEIEEHQLYHLARRNTCRLLPPKLSGMFQVIQDISDGMEMDFWDMRIFEDEVMYVLTNQERSYGAVCILYPEVIQGIADFFSNNFFILPSSIHECIIVPDSGQFISQELKELVQEVNVQCVEEEEILSDNIYYYDRIQQKLSFARSGKWALS